MPGDAGPPVAGVGQDLPAGGALAAFLVIPGRADLARFFSIQLGWRPAPRVPALQKAFFRICSTSRTGPPPSGVLVSRARPARRCAIANRYVIAAALWILAVVGIVSLVRRRRWDVVLLGLGLSAGAVLLVASQHYAYGAYKLLLLGNWVMAAAVTAGAEAIAARVAASGAGRAVRLAIATVGVLIAIAFFGSFALRRAPFISGSIHRRSRRFGRSPRSRE